MTMTAKKLALCISACALLAGCATSASDPMAGTRADKINTALSKAAADAEAQGARGQSLAYLEQIYKRNSADPMAAVNYAEKLRESDYVDRAALVLAPVANSPDSPAAAKTEYAAIQLALGNNKGAEEYAQKAVLQDDTDGRAYHYLGIALDAQGNHVPAEKAFRKALDNWKGDPTPIMNNLALNLASQAFFEEALEILRKAQAVAPDRVEIERNIRIVTALKQSYAGVIPKPGPKPVPVTPVHAESVKESVKAEPVKVKVTEEKEKIEKTEPAKKEEKAKAEPVKPKPIGNLNQ